jgi:hypothetical protein
MMKSPVFTFCSFLASWRLWVKDLGEQGKYQAISHKLSFSKHQVAQPDSPGDGLVCGRNHTQRQAA